jgi:glycosyltransferase involved in cell wall biosynthesis
LKILHVVPSYLPATRYGGPIRSVHGLARAQAARGHDVKVFTTNVDGPTVSPVPVGVPVDINGVEVWYFPTSVGRRLYRSPAMAAALYRGGRSFDIVHLHSVFLWPTMMAARWAIASGTPYILTPRGMLVADLIARKSRWLKWAWIALFERRTIAGAAALHLTSDVELADFMAMGFCTRNIEVIPNAVDVPPVPDVPARNDNSTRPYVLFIGRVNWKKGLDRLIPAMAQVPEVDLLIAGSDEEGYQPHLETLAEQYRVADRIRFLGEVDGDAKWSLLRGATLLALTSYNENFGMVVLEAMAAGCPVLVTPEVGLAAEVRVSGTGVVVSGEPGAIAAAIAGLLQQPELRRIMGQKGRAVTKSKYSWDAIASQMESLYSLSIQNARNSADARHPVRA